MDGAKQGLSGVGKVGAEQLDALDVDVVRASDKVGLHNVGQLVGQALSVEVLLSVVRLVKHDLVGHHNVLEAGLLAGRHRDVRLLVALLEAVVVVRVHHALKGLVHRSESLSIENLFHIIF